MKRNHPVHRDHRTSALKYVQSEKYPKTRPLFISRKTNSKCKNTSPWSSSCSPCVALVSICNRIIGSYSDFQDTEDNQQQQPGASTVLSFSFSQQFRPSALSIKCYVCNATSSPFQCGELFERYDEPDIEPVDCSSVHGAEYCVKHIGRFEGDWSGPQKDLSC